MVSFCESGAIEANDAGVWAESSLCCTLLPKVYDILDNGDSVWEQSIC